MASKRKLSFLKAGLGKLLYYRHFFIATSDKIGQMQPDFFVKQGSNYGLVEVKANTSNLHPRQRDYFRTAERYGLRSMVLKVKVEVNIAKEIKLLEYKHR